MDLDFNLELFIYAFEQTIENDLYASWCMQYPQMTEETFISFANYKKDIMKVATREGSRITNEEIENEMDLIIKQYERR